VAKNPLVAAVAKKFPGGGWRGVTASRWLYILLDVFLEGKGCLYRQLFQASMR